MPRLFKTILLAVLLLGSHLSAQTLTITNATIVDVSNGALRRGTTVVIDGNRIAQCGTALAGASARGQVIDVKGLYLIPGLWDMHAHSYFDSGPPTSARTTCSRSSSPTASPAFATWGAISTPSCTPGRRSPRTGSSVLVSSRRVRCSTVPHAKYKAAIAIATPEDGRKAVDMLKSRGVDFIKVQSGVPREAYFAIAEESKKAGIEFEGHVPDAIRASEAVAAGQRTFEHLIGIFEASSPDEDSYLSRKYGAGKDPSINKSLGAFLDTYDPAREASLIDLLVKNNVWQCPTLFWERGQWLVDAIDYTKDPDIAAAPHSWVEKRYPSMRASILQTLGTDPLAVRVRFVDHELDIVRKLHAAGVPFLAGTDAPSGVDLIPGISLHLELQRFVAAGFTPLQALQTATLNPATFYKKLNDFGSIQAGRIADLVLLRANPLDDIVNTRTIAGVVADGRYFSQQDLEQLRERLRQFAATR